MEDKLNEKIKQNLYWFKDNLESDHTSNMSDGYKDGLIYSLQEFLEIDQSGIVVEKTEEWLKGYNDGKRVIEDERGKL